MASRRVLEVQLIGNSKQLEAAFGKSAVAAETFGKRMRAVGSDIQGVGRKMTTHLALPIVGVAAASAKMSMDFHRSMEMVHADAGATQREVEKMGKAILALSGKVPQGPKELAHALYDLESVGVRGKTALQALTAAAKGAAIGNADLGETTSSLASTMVAYHLRGRDAAKTMGELNAIVGVGKMRMNDLNAALASGVLPTARAIGLQIKDVGAALATMTDAGVPAEQAAQKLRTAFFLMAAPNAKATKALGEINLKQLDVAKAMRGPGGIVAGLALIRQHLSGLSKAQKVQVLSNAFGGSRSAATLVTLVDNLDRVKSKLEAVDKGGRSFGEHWRATQNTAAVKTKEAWSAIQAAMIRVGDALAPIIVQVSAVISRLAMEFERLSPHTQKLILIAVAIAAAIGPVVFIVGSLATAIGLLVSPIGAAIAVVVGLGFAAHAMGVKFSDVKQVAKSVFEAIKNAATTMAQWVTNAFGNVKHAISNAVQWVSTAINNVRAEVGSWKVLWAVVGAVVGNAVSVVRHSLNLILPVVRDVMGTVGAVFRAGWHVVTAVTSAAWQNIKGIVKAGANILAGIVKVITGIFRGDFGRMWSGVKQIFSGGVGAVKTIVLALPRAIIGVFKNLPGDMLNIGKHVIQGLIDGIKAAAGGVLDAVKSVAGLIPNTAKKLLKIFSPSRVMFDIGGNVVKGLALGIVTAAGLVTDAARRALVFPIDAAITALNARKGVLQRTWDAIDARAQRSQLVQAIARAKNSTSLDATTGFGLTGGSVGTGKGAGRGSIASTIISVGKSMGASGKQILAALEAGIVESGLKNLPYGDRDSVGVFQQRPSQGWTGLMNVPKAAAQFFQHAMSVGGRGMSAGALAQAVQRSAFPGRYDAVQSQAMALLGGAGGGGSGVPTRKQLVAATKKKGADQTQIRDAIKALADFDTAAKRAKQLANIDIKVAHLEQLKAFKTAIADIRTGLKAVAQSAADAFRTLREGEINKVHDAAIAAIGNSADAQELARLQGIDAQEADAKTTAQLNKDLATAIASGDKQAQQDALDAIAGYQRQKREQQLTDNLAAATKAADDAQQTALNGLDKEVADFQKALNTKLSAEADLLAKRKENYKTFLKDIQALAAPYGLNAVDIIGTSPDQEAAVNAGPGPAGSGSKGKSPLTFGPTYSLGGHGPKYTLGGHRAAGGPVRAGEAYIVGEHRPEMFVPDRNGQIVPRVGRGWGGDMYLTKTGDVRVGSQVDLRREMNRVAFRLGT